MNWKRILIFIPILFLATAAAAFPFGRIHSFLSASNKPVPIWLPIGHGSAVLVAAIIVFLILAKKQENNTWLHAILVALFTWLVSFPINVLLIGQPILPWTISVVVLFIALSIGTPIGNYMRNKSSEQTENA